MFQILVFTSSSVMFKFLKST